MSHVTYLLVNPESEATKRLHELLIDRDRAVLMPEAGIPVEELQPSHFGLNVDESSYELDDGGDFHIVIEECDTICFVGWKPTNWPKGNEHIFWDTQRVEDSVYQD